MAEKLVIYTAITGGKDTLREPAHRIPGVDYVCFADTPAMASATFTIRPLPFAEKDTRLSARRLKLFPHLLFPDHTASLWIDGSKRIRRDLSPLIAQMAQAPITALRHPARDCVYDEGEDCLLRGRDDAAQLVAQMSAYHDAGYPPHAGLYETSVLFRKHNAALNPLMEAWWTQLQTYSARDQISLPFVLKGSAQAIAALDYRQWHDPYFMQYPHRWYRSGDHRARLIPRAHDILWRCLQNLGLQTHHEQAMRQLKQLITGKRKP